MTDFVITITDDDGSLSLADAVSMGLIDESMDSPLTEDDDTY